VIKVSSGTLSVLGLLDTQVDAPPTTAYLMVGGRCRNDCAFCAQARTSKASAMALSRVSWPSWDEDQVLSAVQDSYAARKISRCCLQVTVSPGYLERVKEIARRLGHLIPLGASVVASADQAGQLLEAGLERVGLALDAASEETQRRVKGGHLAQALAVIEEAAHLYPGRIATHLIVGLGETEEEVIRMIGRLSDLGVSVALFAFTPVPGTAMEGEAPPVLGSYRRVQVAHHLLVRKLARIEDFTFSPQGRIVSFGRPADELKVLLADGTAFETSGCPGCNRPYYNERPGGPLYNYPRPLTANEAEHALDQAFSQSLMQA
jgi:biotin synthase-related radical SAM superfamily protein